jgi:hypothetical protein
MLLYPQAQELYPIGSVIESNSPPNNKWERCYGQIVLQSDYPKLFSIMENPHPMRYSKWVTHSNTITGQTPYFSSDIIYGATKYVIVGAGGSISYSSDLLNWTCIKPFGTSIYFYCLAFNGTTFCTLPGSPSSNTTYTSTDGVNWTAHAGVLPVASYWSEITWDGTYFLAVSASGYAGVVRSLDGTTWEVAVASIPYGTNAIGHQTIVSDGNGMVVLSSGGNKVMAYSTDHGSTWDITAIHPYSDVMNMSYENGKFLAAMEYQTNGYSDDGIDWTFENGNWFYYGAPYYQNPVRAYEDDDIYRWKYFNGIYFGVTYMQRMVYSTDFVEFRQHIFSPDEDLNLDAIAYDSGNDRILGYAGGSDMDVYELTCAYDMDTYFQFPLSLGDLRFDYGKHRYIRVR